MDTAKKRRYICLAVINGIALILFAVFSAVTSAISNSLPSQLAAERWNSDDSVRMAQISVFYSKDILIGINEIYTARVNIEKKLSENSVAAVNENARAWIDAFSADCSLMVSSDRKNVKANIEVNAVATGGDYFIFHPLKLLSGAYYSDNDLMKDRVILDENLAWQLFGSSDVAGMTVLIGSQRFYIAAVVEPEDDKATEYVYGSKPRMYLPYNALINLYGADSVPITTYETCMPDAVTGLAKSIVTEVAVMDENNTKIVENSDRYSLKNLFTIAFDGGKRAVIDSSIVYPFWENAARITEEKASAMAVTAAVMLIIPVSTVLYFVGLLIYNRKKIFQGFVKKVRTFIYNKKQNKVADKMVGKAT